MPPVPPSLATTLKLSVSGKLPANPVPTRSSAVTGTGPAPTTPPSPGVTTSAVYRGTQTFASVHAWYGAHAGSHAPPSALAE
ncbi:MAG TPA: hypothetical protein VFZ09_41490 [Archangium sp.]|uniref:hypothetical protein n=1 Tax=Archangium sp. TaxID=1872627 RepID=UPI002E322668|nr:hypothetical protein [Archangium sp.]HEX5752752.1 hypothetical protein [Archangium sp.]